MSAGVFAMRMWVVTARPLRQSGLVEHAGAAAFQVPAMPSSAPMVTHAGAADAGDQEVPGLRQVGRMAAPASGELLGRRDRML